MAQANNPLVSMIVLCYNQARFVVETLESVKAQTYQPTQLIIYDDCSSDGSAAVIENWLQENKIDCTFIRHQENQGICKSLNEALSLATGKYISMVASDDLWLPDKTARQVEIMEAQPDDVGVLYSDAFQIDEHGNVLPDMFIAAHRSLPVMPQGQILDILLEGNFIPGMTALIRRSCFDKVGLYDETLPFEDWDMWMRIAGRYSFIHSPAPSAKYRIHDQSYSRSNRKRMVRGTCRICLKQLRIGDLNADQKLRLTSFTLKLSEHLYNQQDAEVPEILLAVWRATGSKRARWMYRFARFGATFQDWQKARNSYMRLQHMLGLAKLGARGRRPASKPEVM
jgi:glycosyl transferase family 2